MKPLNISFVIEQTLGNKTYTANLKKSITPKLGVQPHWIEIPYEFSPWTSLLFPPYRNFAVRTSLRARRSLMGSKQLDAIFFQTQLTSLFSVSLMHKIPTIISTDVTPIGFDSLSKFYFQGDHRLAGNGPIDTLKHRIYQRAFNAASALTTWSDWARLSLINDYGIPSEKIHVIPPGINFEDWKASPRLPVDNRPIRILFVGGHFKRKGGDLLLKVWREQFRGCAELHLVTQANIPSEPGVYLYQGLQPNSLELRRLYAEADIFALPTLSDTFGIVLAEAGAAGLPVVSTSIAGIPEIVWHGESGLLCPSGDVNALAGALKQLIDNPEMRIEMGRKGREIVTAHFDADKNAKRLVELFRNFI